MPDGKVSAGGGFPQVWRVFALLEVLLGVYRAYRGRFQWAQLMMDVDYRSVVDACNNGRPRNPTTHELQIGLFEL